MSTLAIAASHWRPNPALQDPEQALWSELRFAPQPLDIFELVMGAARFFADPLQIDVRPLHRWIAAGLVAVTGKPKRYSLERSASAMASPPPPPPTVRATALPKQTQRQRLWTAMRVLGTFDLPTLLIAAEAPRNAALDIISILTRGGWLRATETGWTTRGGRAWGPVAPTWTRYAIGWKPIIRITDHRDGSIVEVAARTRRDPAQDSSAEAASGGGVG